MSDDFAAPAPSGGGVDFKELNGALLLVQVTGNEVNVKTSYGISNPVRCDLTVLDGPLAGTTYDDTLIFPKVLIGQLKSRVGEKVLGRLGQGEQKPGQSPPWVLADATEADKKVARAHLAAAPASAPF